MYTIYVSELFLFTQLLYRLQCMYTAHHILLYNRVTTQQIHGMYTICGLFVGSKYTAPYDTKVCIRLFTFILDECIANIFCKYSY
jgi:hypothetical protein